jgi:hypothetical protein
LPMDGAWTSHSKVHGTLLHLAHPDIDHHLCWHIKCLMAHCLRVTAAVALFNSGEDKHLIAFQLRWNSDAVRIYLQDCYKSIGTLTARALQGAFSDIPAPPPPNGAAT